MTIFNCGLRRAYTAAASTTDGHTGTGPDDYASPTQSKLGRLINRLGQETRGHFLTYRPNSSESRGLLLSS